MNEMAWMRRVTDKNLAFGLAVLASLVSLTFVLTLPFEATLVSTVDGIKTRTEHSFLKVPMALVLLQSASALSMVLAAVLVLRRRFATARRWMLAGAVLGISVVPVPTALALGAYLLIRNREDRE